MSGRNIWIKLPYDFFNKHEILYLESFEDGHYYVRLYLNFLLHSLKHDGKLRFSEEIPYTPKILSPIMRMPEKIIEEGIEILSSIRLLVVSDDGTYFFPELTKMIGSESSSAARVRKFRKNASNINKTALQCNADVTPCNDPVTARNEVKRKSNIELELELELEKEKIYKKEKQKKAYGEYKNVLLTDEDVKRLQERYGLKVFNVVLEEMSCWLKSKGKKYKDYAAALNNWIKKEIEKKPEKYIKEEYGSFDNSKRLKERR